MGPTSSLLQLVLLCWITTEVVQSARCRDVAQNGHYLAPESATNNDFERHEYLKTDYNSCVESWTTCWDTYFKTGVSRCCDDWIECMDRFMRIYEGQCERDTVFTHSACVEYARSLEGDIASASFTLLGIPVVVTVVASLVLHMLLI